MTPSIYEYIKKEEANFETDEVQVGDNWNWNFRNHIQLIMHLKNGVFFTGENNWLRSFKNIMEPILNLSYWTEDIDVKDVTFFIESKGGRVLSFLIKKYHDEVYVREHDIDTLFDQITESDLDYGGALVQSGLNTPELLHLNTVAFCDQTDIEGGPIGFKMYMTPSKLRTMAKAGWGSEKNGANISIEDLCVLATAEKEQLGGKGGMTNKVTGKSIEIYIVRGDLPEHYLEDNDEMDYHCSQIQIVGFYTNEKGKSQGVTLYRKKADAEDILFHSTKPIIGRALGRGVGETIIHPQIWTNFLEIHKTGMLEAGAKTLLSTDDPAYTNRNKIQDMDNLEITVTEEGKVIRQIPTANPAGIQLIEGSINSWFTFAQTAGAADDPLMGKEAASGTTFRGQERSVAQGRGLHDKRRGQRAKFFELLYRKFIIPDIVSEILEGKEFMATLTTEELTWVADQLATNETNTRIKDMILNEGKMVTKEEQDMFTETFKTGFLKKGNKHLIKMLKKEFTGVEVKMGINIAGKQKNIAGLSDKLLSVFETVLANPQGFQQTMQIPAMARAFEDILEYSGLTITDFTSLQAPPQAIQAPQEELQAPQGTPEPMMANTPV